MRLLTYILVGAGAAIAVVALAVVLLDDGEQQTVAPQTETGQPAVVIAESGDTSDSRTNSAPDGDAAGDGDAQSGGGEVAPPTVEAPAVEIDLAQVRPDGNAVFAGKAPPNAKVTVFEGEIVLGTTTADASGEWVIVPEKALGTGEHLISVGAETADGETNIANVTLGGEASADRGEVGLSSPQRDEQIDSEAQTQAPAVQIETVSELQQPQSAEEASLW